MTKEEKELLIKDLCARLPYGVKLKIREWKTPVELTIIRRSVLSGNYIINENYKLDDIKPYLRPMSSMTEEERTEYLNACGNEMDNAFSSPRYGGIDYLKANHFDYRGLIPKGLANSTEEFNPYKD